MNILTGDQVRAVEQAYSRAGMPPIVMMERAALTVAEQARTMAGPGQRIDLLCGPGNNGGDGLAAARILHGWGQPVRVLLFDGLQLGALCSQQLQMAEYARVPVAHADDAGGVDQFMEDLPGLYVDALFGIGLSRPPQGLYAHAISRLNASGRPVLAVDIPSGLPAELPTLPPLMPGEPEEPQPLFQDTAQPEWSQALTVSADCTITFTAPKPAQLFYPGRQAVGRLVVQEIGMEPSAGQLIWLDEQTITPWLPQRLPQGHKNTYGHAGLVAGSPAMPGAAALMAQAACRSGAGLCSLYSPVLPQGLPDEAMWAPADQTALMTFAENKTALGIGPGLGRGPQAAQWLHTLLQDCDKPLLLDADALNLLQPQSLSLAAGRAVITPHPGEFVRLFGCDKQLVLQNPLQAALQAADRYGVVVLLKGATTCIARPDGFAAVYTGGHPGMATGGSGDVLSGIITGLLAQGLQPFEAACCGAWLHGKAGCLAAQQYGPASMTAGDIARSLHL